ncbi:MAG: transcriptional repressor [Nanoarchaeota archaeon]|nr:transcriptional repressor [Nanoarchaeota archaeon]
MKNSRKTKQKEILEKEINKIESFFTAEDLLEKANKIDEKIGIATIYRFLKELTKKGELHSYLCNRKKIYSKNKKSHCHFKCKRCGKSSHINIESLDFLKKQIKSPICHFQIDITGTCENCLKNNNK